VTNIIEKYIDKALMRLDRWLHKRQREHRSEGNKKTKGKSQTKGNGEAKERLFITLNLKGKKKNYSVSQDFLKLTFYFFYFRLEPPFTTDVFGWMESSIS